MGSHSVEDHLKLSVLEYDTIIRTLVPFYDEMISAGVEILAGLVSEEARVLDIGCGTGRLSKAVLEKLPEAHLELVDIDPKILNQARERFAGDDRVGFHLLSFFDKVPQCDAAVASLSLHHVPRSGDKTAVYKNIYSALRANGLFLCMDASIPSDPRASAKTFEGWIDHMIGHGIAPEAARQNLLDWRKEEHYFSIFEELKNLAVAGFTNPECFWRKGPMAIYGAFKS